MGTDSGGDTRVQLLVIIVTHNAVQDVEGLLECLPAAVGRELAWDLVVVDSASDDATVAIVRETSPRARVIELQRNLGYAAGINAGVSAFPDHDVVVVLNADVRLEPGSIPALASNLQQPGVGIVAPRLVTGQGRRIDSIRRRPTIRGLWAEALLGNRFGSGSHSREIVTDDEPYGHRQVVDWASGPVLAFSRACYRAVSGWDESYFLYSEETDFCLRAADEGFRTIYEPDVTATHFEGESASSPFLWSLLVRNRYIHFRRRNGVFRSVPYWLGLVVREALRSREEVHAEALRRLLRPRPLLVEVERRTGSTRARGISQLTARNG